MFVVCRKYKIKLVIEIYNFHNLLASHFEFFFLAKFFDQYTSVQEINTI